MLLEGLECSKDTQVKDYDITKVIAELKNSDNLWYRNKIDFSLGCFRGRGLCKVLLVRSILRRPKYAYFVTVTDVFSQWRI